MGEMKRHLENQGFFDYNQDQAKPISENRIPCEWLSTKEAATYLSLTENALRICVHRGQVKAYKFGSRLRFKLIELRQVPSTKGG